MKYSMIETTVDSVIEQAPKARFAFEYHSNALTEASCVVGDTVYRAEGTLPKADHGIVEVQHGDLYLRWTADEPYDREAGAKAYERQQQQAFTQWKAAVQSRKEAPQFRYLANYQQEFPQMPLLLGYGQKDIVLDAVYDHEHYQVILDGRSGRTLEAVQRQMPGNYENFWKTVAPMFRSGELGLKRRNRPVGLEKIPGTPAERQRIADWCLVIDHHPNSVGRAPKSL